MAKKKQIPKEEYIKRFEKKLFYSPDGCWYWTGNTLAQGRYGAFIYNGKSRLAHRCSFVLFKGPIPIGMCVCHTCDNTLCVNPYHLFIGTHLDNMRDMIKKGRDKHDECARGEQHWNSKLKSEDVIYIRSSVKTNLEIAKEFGLNPDYVSEIRRFKKWKMIKDGNSSAYAQYFLLQPKRK